MLTSLIGFVLLGAVFGYKHEDVDMNHEPFYELPCLSFGGICMVADECPEGLLAKVSGLCPVQQRLGVECCHGLPKSETRCKRRGGECMPPDTRCPDNLTYKKATDCGVDETCCMLVN